MRQAMINERLTLQEVQGAPVSQGRIAIRPMVESDLDEVLLIEEAIYTMPWKRSMFQNELRKNPYSHPFVVLDQHKGSMVGYVCFWIVMDELHLLNLSVHPNNQAKGFGKELAGWVIRYGRERGVRKASLEVRGSNTRAIGLYKKMGFKVKAVRPGYYREPRENGLIMVREDDEKEVRRMNEDDTLKEQLRIKHPEFRRLFNQHLRLDEQIKQMFQRKVLTPVEELQRKQLQVEKLHTKDQMEAILREHRRIGASQR
jgi:[ribosomal protein S18]-alanine N-acetyltransferase